MFEIKRVIVAQIHNCVSSYSITYCQRLFIVVTADFKEGFIVAEKLSKRCIFTT